MSEILQDSIFLWFIGTIAILTAFSLIQLFGLWLARITPNHGTNEFSCETIIPSIVNGYYNEFSGKTLIESIANGHCTVVSCAWKKLKTSWKSLWKEPIEFSKEFICYFKKLWEYVSNRHWILGAIVVIVAALNEWIYYSIMTIFI